MPQRRSARAPLNIALCLLSPLLVEDPPASQGDDPGGASRLRRRAHFPAGEAEAGAGNHGLSGGEAAADQGGRISAPRAPRATRRAGRKGGHPGGDILGGTSRRAPRQLPAPSIHSLPSLVWQDEEKEGAELPASLQSGRDAANPQHPLSLLPSGSYEEDPQAILDEHLSRVLKTPGCQSPGVGRHSPRARSPDRLPAGKLPPGTASLAACALLGKGFITKQTTKHVHHHYIHHHTVPKTKEQIEAEAAQRVQCCCPAGGDYYCYPKCKGHPKNTDPPLSPLEPFG